MLLSELQTRMLQNTSVRYCIQLAHHCRPGLSAPTSLCYSCQSGLLHTITSMPAHPL